MRQNLPEYGEFQVSGSIYKGTEKQIVDTGYPALFSNISSSRSPGAVTFLLPGLNAIEPHSSWECKYERYITEEQATPFNFTAFEQLPNLRKICEEVLDRGSYLIKSSPGLFQACSNNRESQASSQCSCHVPTTEETGEKEKQPGPSLQPLQCLHALEP